MFILGFFVRLLLVLLFIVAILSPLSLAYWSNSLSIDPINCTTTIYVGNWPEYIGAKNYQPNEIYFYNERVIYDGKLWIVIKMSVFNKTPGKTIGDYNEVTNYWRQNNVYQNGDIVFHLGKWWISNRKNHAQEPGLTLAWSILP